MSNKKISTFSIFLLLGIAAALFVPATALQNSIAMAQEYYEKNEQNEYYNQQYDPYKNYKENAPIVNIEKKLFVCNNVNGIPDNITEGGDFIKCTSPANPIFPAGPDSGQYIPCDDEICPFIDESDFGTQIFKDVATVLELSPEGTPVNLDKFHYTVTEGPIDQRISSAGSCSVVGFDSSNLFTTLLEDGSWVQAIICVNYVGDCEGTIYPDEVKTCTIENYLVEVDFFPPPSNDDPEQSSSSSFQQSNNQAIQSQPSFLADIISD